MKVSVITVTWNSKDFILQQIQSVKNAAAHIQVEQIIVDNQSEDGTAELIQKNFPEITVIVNSENKGFGRANNQAVNISKGDYLLFLNPDMELEAGSLDILVDWMEKNSSVGIVGPKLVTKKGVINLSSVPRRFPRIWEQLAIVFKLPHIFPSLLDDYLLTGFDSNREQLVDSVQGSCMLVRRELIEKLGFAFDPRYFIWFEDVDLCREARRLGYEVTYTPVVSAIDYGGQSFKKRNTWWKQKQYIRSMLTYFRKWGISKIKRQK